MSKVQYFDHNFMGQDYIVGDLHGCLQDLFILLNHVKFDRTKDRLFSVGDLVDRGPDSMGCLQLLREQWFFAVLGNHEQMMLDALKHKHSYSDQLNHWLINGGIWHKSENELDLADICDYVKELPLVIVIGKDSDNRINIVHAELYRDKNQDSATDEDVDDWYFDEINETNMVWGRQIVQLKSLYQNKPQSGLSLTVVGHTPIEYSFEVLNHKFIDTGAVFWHKQEYEQAKLTMMRVSDHKLFSLQMNSGVVDEI